MLKSDTESEECERDSLEGEEEEEDTTLTTPTRSGDGGEEGGAVGGGVSPATTAGDASSIGEQQDKDLAEEIVVEMPTRVVFKDPEAKKMD